MKTAFKAMDVVFLRIIRNALRELEEMYRKHEDLDYFVTWTEVNKYNRLNKMLKRIDEMAKKEYKEVAKTIKNSQENVYLEEHNAQIFVTERETQKRIDFDIPNAKEIRAAIEQPIDKINIDKSLEKHRDTLQDKIRIHITQGLMNGDGYSIVAKAIQKDIEVSKSRALTIARTELGRAKSQAMLDSAMQVKANGLDIKKRWHATLDARTRHDHRELDGQVKRIDEPFEINGCSGQAPYLFVGVKSASENINCRCTLLTFIDEDELPTSRRARDDNETYNVNDMTYREWEKMKQKS